MTPAPETIVWKYDVIGADIKPSSTGVDDFVKLVDELSGGRMEIKPYFKGALGYKPQDSLKVAGEGLVEMAQVGFPYYGRTIPACALPSLPFMIGGVGEWSAIAGQIMPILNETLNKNGVVTVHTAVQTPQMLATTKQVLSLEDLKGLKIRVSGVELSDFIKRIGAAPVTTSMAEMYQALQRGVIEGAITGVHVHYNFKLYEVEKYLMTPPISGGVTAIIANKQAFEALPTDLQQVILEAGKRTETGILAAEAPSYVNYLAKMREVGVTIYSPPPDVIDFMKGQAVIIWGEWGKRVGPEGEQLLAVARGALHR